MKTLRLATLLFLASLTIAVAQPRVLIVTAHPDDESGCASTVYKITHELGGTVDLAVITNGEAGYKYSTFASEVYGLDLTNEAVGRRELPAIRKKELMAGGKWVGIKNYFFFDQTDTHYTLDCDTVLRSVWDVAWVKQRLTKILQQGGYDFVFTMLPTDSTHGHHKAAGIIALQTVSELPAGTRLPVVLGMGGGRVDGPRYTELPRYSITRVDPDTKIYVFDRMQKFGFKNALDYRTPANWLIAEHKSQGVMQTYINMGDKETFYYFAMNGASRNEEVAVLFDALARPRKQ